MDHLSGMQDTKQMTSMVSCRLKTLRSGCAARLHDSV